jgi:malonyl-CoA/methylmalonyl-CoA synthetase
VISIRTSLNRYRCDPRYEDFGEAVAAIVTSARGALIDEQPVQAALTKMLAKFKVPKRVTFVKELPRNAMGKVQKNLLRERFGDLFTPHHVSYSRVN